MTVEAEIRRRIGQHGAITFAEFMELALFWPDGGYYVTNDPTGAEGDFYTSPQVHPVFGALLAVQLFQMWRLLGQPDLFPVVELGAGNGLLCRDIMAAAAGLPPPFSHCLTYVCLDRRRAIGLESTLNVDGTGASIPSLSSASSLAATGIPFRRLVGCFISNEYFDAFPVHQVKMVDGQLLEIYVNLEDGELVTQTGELSDPALAARFDDLALVLKDGQTAEVNLGLTNWAQEVGQALEAGFILTVDYGDPAPELYSPDRRLRGTLTTFHNHVQIDAPLRHIGRQDITAQVDFTSLVNAGREWGVEPLGFASQAQFLGRLGLRVMQQKSRRLDLPQNAAQANRAGMLDLARPGGLGDFKVLVQGKALGQPQLWGFNDLDESGSEARELPDALVKNMPIPLLTSQHLSLLQGRYPGGEIDFELDSLFGNQEPS